MRRVHYLYDSKEVEKLEALLDRMGPTWIAIVIDGTPSNMCRRRRLRIPWKLEELIAIEKAAGIAVGTFWTLKTNSVPNRWEREAEQETWLTAYEYVVQRMAQEREAKKSKNRNRVPVLDDRIPAPVK